MLQLQQANDRFCHTAITIRRSQAQNQCIRGELIRATVPSFALFLSFSLSFSLVRVGAEERSCQRQNSRRFPRAWRAVEQQMREDTRRDRSL